MKNIVLIGSGNLAEALARAISRTEGATLLQIFARNAKRGTALALENGTAWSSDPRELAAADLYLLAVSDAAITTLAESLPIPAEAAVVHTAGGIGIEALPARFDRRGVLYPLQTFTQGRSVDFAKIPLFVEGNDDTFTSELEAFARNLSRTVYRADSDRRVRLHLAAVFACNFVNHLYALGGEILHGTELPFDVLNPRSPKPQPKPSIRAIRIGCRPGLPYAATCRRCGDTKPHSLTIRDCYEFMNH